MQSKITQNLTKDGYTILRNCVDLNIINNIKKSISGKLAKIANNQNLNDTKNLTRSFSRALEVKKQYDIQLELSKTLEQEGLIEKLFKCKKVLEKLILLLGPDLEYMTDFEIAINDNKSKNDGYLVKKFHQEFWSGMGLEAIQSWTPINLKKNMGTIEIVKGSHLWGHIPHQERKPIIMPKNYETIKININEGSMVLFSSLTLHRTLINNVKEPRIALPITLRNFYHPNTNNMDLFNFKKINYSFYSNIRKKLGNAHLSPFRTIKLNT